MKSTVSNIALKENKISKPIIQSGIGGASANLTNSIIGAGIIGIPYALKQSGLLTGVFLLLIVGFLTNKSLRLIIGLASFHPSLRSRNVCSYEDLMSYPFGQIGVTVVLINMFVLAYGAMVVYLLIIKDTVPILLGFSEHDLIYRNVIMFLTSLFVMVPLSLQRDMASLALTSAVSVCADIALVFFIVFYSPITNTLDQKGGLPHLLATDGIKSTLFIGLGILSAAMTCQHSAFIVSESLKDRTMKRWSLVTGLSIGTATILCGMLGICGYLGFLDQTKGDILNNFETENIFTNGARILLAVTMFFTYPMESFVARHVVITLFHQGDIDGNRTSDTKSLFQFRINRRYKWTFGIYILSLIPAILLSDIGPILSITGAVGGSFLAYIGPGCLYLGVNGEEFLMLAYRLVGHNYDIEMKKESILIINDTNLNGKKRYKPFWWYLVGFPIWCRIASRGINSMSENLSCNGRCLDSSLSSSPVDETVNDRDEVLVPSCREFILAIFFIIFGTICAFVGVISNISNSLK